MKRWIIVIVLLPLMLLALGDREYCVHFGSDSLIGYRISRAKTDAKNNPTFYALMEKFIEKLREKTGYKYSFVLLCISNTSDKTVSWFDEEDKIILQINGSKVKSSDYASKRLTTDEVNDLQDLWNVSAKKYNLPCMTWDVFVGNSCFVLPKYPTPGYPYIVSLTDGYGFKVIGFEKRFSWNDIEKIWIKVDGETHEMEKEAE